MGKGKPKKVKGKKKVALPMPDDSSSKFDKCPTCSTTPKDNWGIEDWNSWESGVCPNCLTDMNELEVEGVGGSGVVVYEKGVKKTYPSYDEYHKSKFGHSYYETNSDYAYGANWGSICSHDDAVEIAPGLEIKAFSYRGATHQKMKTLDYFVALDSIWLDEGEILTTPGVNFRIPTNRTLPKFLYLVTPDFGTPNSLRIFIELVEWTLHQLKTGKKVGVGCMGGHGRTGVFLTALLVAAGTFKTGAAATAYVRKAYCKEAVESASQAALLTSVGKHIWGPGADGDLSAVEEDILNAKKVVSSLVVTPDKIYDWGVLPKTVRVKEGVGEKYPDARGYENTVLNAIEWGMSRNAVIALTPKGVRLTLYETEYDVVEKGAPKAPTTFTRVTVRPGVKEGYLKQFSGKACHVLGSETIGTNQHGEPVTIVKVLLPDGAECRLYPDEYIPIVDWSDSSAKESETAS